MNFQKIQTVAPSWILRDVACSVVSRRKTGYGKDCSIPRLIFNLDIVFPKNLSSFECYVAIIYLVFINVTVKSRGSRCLVHFIHWYKPLKNGFGGILLLCRGCWRVGITKS